MIVHRASLGLVLAMFAVVGCAGSPPPRPPFTATAAAIPPAPLEAAPPWAASAPTARAVHTGARRQVRCRQDPSVRARREICRTAADERLRQDADLFRIGQ